MSERELIIKTRMGKTKKGEPQAELFGNNLAFSYPVLYLRNLSLLTEVSIDPDALTADPIHMRYWAHYELSERVNTKGNPYRDILYLEPINTPATSTSTDTSALLQELRAIRQLLERLLATGGQPPATPAPVPLPALTNNEHDIIVNALSANDARAEFYTLTGPAITAGKLDPLSINTLIRTANGQGWNEALVQLQELLNAK